MASLIFLIGFNWELQEFLAIIQQEREWRIFMAQHEKFYLNGTWQLKKADETLLCPVEIPGSVLSGLTEHGLLEDPFYRMNEYPTRELLKNDFIFSREFELKKEEGRVYALCCDGIDTVADIFINGMLIKHVDNMHLRYRILVHKCPEKRDKQYHSENPFCNRICKRTCAGSGKRDSLHGMRCDGRKSVYPESTFHVWLGLGATVTGYGDLA